MLIPRNTWPDPAAYDRRPAGSPASSGTTSLSTPTRPPRRSARPGRASEWIGYDGSPSIRTRSARDRSLMREPSVRRPVYLDNHATTRTDPRVVEAMLPYFTEHYGNAASVSHRFGWEAEEAVERAREQVARAIGAEAGRSSSPRARPNRTTSPSRDWPRPRPGRGNHLVTASSEHKAVLDPMKRLARAGLGGHDRRVRRARPGIGRSGGRCPDRSDGPGLRHGGEQRGRHDQPDRRDRPALPRTRHRLPHRCRPGRRQGPARRPARCGRPAQPLGTQVLRAKGDRRTLRPASRSPGAAPAAVRWRRSRARIPQRDARRYR